MERYIQTHNTNPHFHTSPTLLHYSLNFQPDFPTKQCRRRAKITWIFDRKITFLHACMDFLFIVILVFLGGYLPVSWKLPPSNSGKGANDGLFRDFWLNNGKSTPPWNYRGRTWNWMIGRLSPFLWGQKAYFSGANLRFFSGSVASILVVIFPSLRTPCLAWPKGFRRRHLVEIEVFHVNGTCCLPEFCLAISCHHFHLKGNMNERKEKEQKGCGVCFFVLGVWGGGRGTKRDE